MQPNGETVGRTVKRTYATRNEEILREPEDFCPLCRSARCEPVPASGAVKILRASAQRPPSELIQKQLTEEGRCPKLETSSRTHRHLTREGHQT